MLLGLINHFGLAANAGREKKGQELIDWNKQLALARDIFGMKVRSKRRGALESKKVHPYFEFIPLHSPLQVLVYYEDDKNRLSYFYRSFATVGRDWKANEKLGKMLYVSK
jgi:hypothetical protein